MGFAIAEESLRARYGKKLMDHHTYVIAGDGCLMEGVSHEAIGLAGRQSLGKLIVLWDNNNITIDGSVDLADRTDQVKRFRAAGWHVQEIDGHDPAAIDAALTEAKRTRKPSMIACKTHIALGHAAQDTSKGHGALTDADQNAAAKQAYGWTHPPFVIPDEIKTAWEAIGARGAEEQAAWQARLEAASPQRQAEIARVFAREVPGKLSARIKALKKQVSEEAPKVATRKASEMVLEVVNPVMPETIGGSADLSGSNNTRSGDMTVFDEGNRKGRYIHYGIREHGMAAAMNGMVLHGGVRPYGGTFMCFTDYARPAMRLAALMKIPTVFVMTHDSIGLGEDGPTHQPVEHLAISARHAQHMGVPPLRHGRDRRGVGTGAESKETPSVLSLTRQGLPTLRREHKTKNLTAQGAYVLADATASGRRSCWPPDRRWRSPWRRAICCRRPGSARAWSRCPAGSCSRSRRTATAAACCPPARCASRSRRRSALAGTAGFTASAGAARRAALSGCTISAPRPRRRCFTSSSASRPRPWPRRSSRCCEFGPQRPGCGGCGCVATVRGAAAAAPSPVRGQAISVGAELSALSEPRIKLPRCNCRFACPGRTCDGALLRAAIAPGL